MSDSCRTPCDPVLESWMQPELFKALGDPVRLTLLRRLAGAQRPLTVSEVSECCGVHLSGVSRHLAVLRRAGVVTAVRNGREVLYRLEFQTLGRTLSDLARALESCCPPDRESDDRRTEDATERRS